MSDDDHRPRHLAGSSSRRRRRGRTGRSSRTGGEDARPTPAGETSPDDEGPSAGREPGVAGPADRGPYGAGGTGGLGGSGAGREGPAWGGRPAAGRGTPDGRSGPVAEDRGAYGSGRPARFGGGAGGPAAVAGTTGRASSGAADGPTGGARYEQGPARAGHDDGHDDDHGAGGPPPSGGPGGRTPRRRTPGWLAPAALATVMVAAIGGAVTLDRDPASAAVGAEAQAATPVLSARRVPEVIAEPVADRRLGADLRAWVAQSPADTCLVVESGDTPLFAHNPAAPLAGASTQKVVTAAALLLALGPDTRFETAVRATAAPAGGVVAGDVYLVGGGDPLLTSPGYADRMPRDPSVAVDPGRLADAIVDAGITRIDGSVVGDGSRYDGQRFHPSWPERFRAREAGPIGALTINDGRMGVDGATPPAGGVNADPAANAATVVTELLRQRGVTVVGPPRAGAAPGGLTHVVTFLSATVREMVAEMLTDSDDDTAEMAIKELGRVRSDEGSWEAGAAATTAVLQEAGIALDGVQIVEGSGLSTSNRLTCQLLVDLVAHPDVGPVLIEGMAVAGDTGTLEDRWNGTPVEGRLQGKTGTLNTVTALTGRVSPLQGGALTFSYVANVPDGQVLGPQDVALQDELGAILVNYPRGVDPATLVPADPAPAG